MTTKQEQIFNKMSTKELQKARSIYFDKPEIVEYIDNLLDKPSVDDAMIEYTPLDDFGQM